jgi:hypothetical protein
VLLKALLAAAFVCSSTAIVVEVLVGVDDVVLVGEGDCAARRASHALRRKVSSFDLRMMAVGDELPPEEQQ